VRIKDRFVDPQPSGFRDILLNVRMSNGHIAEFRVSLARVFELAGTEHALYEVTRSISAAAAGRPGGALTPEETAIIYAIHQQTNPLFGAALTPAAPAGRR
jgi:hypothetical protein